MRCQWKWTAGLILCALSFSAMGGPADLYYKNKVKWKSKHNRDSTKIYQYYDEDDANNIRRYHNRYQGQQNLNVGNVNVGRHSSVREVHTVVDMDRLNTNLKKGSQVNVGNVSIDKNSNVRKVQSVIELGNMKVDK